MCSVRSPGREPGHREGGMSLVVPPRLEVVGDEDRVETVLLRPHGEVDELTRPELLRRSLPSNLEHQTSSSHPAPNRGSTGDRTGLRQPTTSPGAPGSWSSTGPWPGGGPPVVTSGRRPSCPRRCELLEQCHVADVDAAVRRAVVPAAREVTRVMNGLAAAEEHRVRHRRVVKVRDDVDLLPRDPEDALARRLGLAAEADGHRVLSLPVDDPRPRASTC